MVSSSWYIGLRAYFAVSNIAPWIQAFMAPNLSGFFLAPRLFTVLRLISPALVSRAFPSRTLFFFSYFFFLKRKGFWGLCTVPRSSSFIVILRFSSKQSQ
ncbi:hypothetical protein BD289DRAFT_62485 [Coniella lustricola]|uniref:Uncharacterized protein n=1 Tax=Coniella lustricola TaxID=2025994 RepID=A0A2T3A0F7_9PEZI|nr:hypothetical protein BD289DRAFT_62485 [Coniella lustricola]